MSRELERRLSALEAVASPARYADWPLEDQAENVLHGLWLNQIGGTVYLATDRELRVLGILHARDQLPEETEGGEVELSSGVVVRFVLEDGAEDAEVYGVVEAEDLPEGVREHLRRMPADRQPRREQWLFENRRAHKENRELAEKRIAWHHEHGWDKRTPQHLLPGGGR